MKILYLAILSVFFISCGQKEMKVPVNDNPGLNEIWDNSRIYITMDVDDYDTIAKVKFGQSITTTHWLIAVDKRFKLKQLIKPIHKVLKKRHKKSIHSKEGAHAYFTYLDSVHNKIAFIDFDSISIQSEVYQSNKYFEKYVKEDEDLIKYHLVFTPQKIVLNNSLSFSYQTPKDEMFDVIWKYVSKKTIEKDNVLYLNFDKNLNFDTFLNYYTFFKNNKIPKGKLSAKIFIY